MRLYAAAFSEQGRNLIKKIGEIPLVIQYGGIKLIRGGTWVEGKMTLCVRRDEPLAQWAARAFDEGAPIIFVGAMGIAVRAIAGAAFSKKTDSPVLVVDERGKFVIPLLSGHLGGANELAVELAKTLGAQPVITTATDVNGLFAVDVFARRNNLSIVDTSGIAKVSAKLLRGEAAYMTVEGIRPEELPELGMPPEITPLPWLPNSWKWEDMHPDIAVCSVESAKELRAELVLTERDYVLGVGCRREKSADEMLAALRKAEEDKILRLEEIAAVASIDRKKEEPGLLDLAQRIRRPFCVFSPEELMNLPGAYTASSFVEQTVGVDNVCERAAVAAAGGGTIVIPKTAGDGMTFAVARLSEDSRKERRLVF